MNYREFKAEVESIVDCAYDEADDNDEARDEYIWETVDGHEWIIYTAQAWDLVNFARGHSDILEAGEQHFEDMGLEVGSDGLDMHMTRLAFCILHAACNEELWNRRESA